MKPSLKTPVVLMLLLLAGPGARPAASQVLPAADNPNKPGAVVKLIFIHHSVGQNWLTDGYGNLGKRLGANNYFVSDTNYGWGPNGIGDRTDIANWLEWFRSEDTPTYMSALFTEDGQNSTYTRTLADPGGENEIILFKSCYPNSELTGNPNDPPDANDPAGSVGYSKTVYNEILKYFRTKPDKLFVVITASPVQSDEWAANARAFNNWLVFDWLTDNAYPFHNVAIFDFYNVLTDPDAHHRWYNGAVQHVAKASNTLFYDSDGDNHPNVAGSQKATNEFAPLLNVFYHRWKDLDKIGTKIFSSAGAEDGWVLESGEGTNVGGSLNSALDYFKVGDCNINRRYRGYLSFNTAEIPDDAVIASAVLKVKSKSAGVENPMTWSALKADIKKGYFGASAGLQISDFQAGVGNAGLSPAAEFVETLSNGWYLAAVAENGLPFISKTGRTQFRLRFAPGTDNDSVPDNLRLHSGDALAGNRPRLVVVWVQ